MSEHSVSLREKRGRVLHIVDTLAPGGAQAVLKAYLEAKRANDEVHSLYALRRAPIELDMVIRRMTIDPSWARFSLVPLLRLRGFIRRHDVTVLHCHLFRAQVFGYLLKQLFFRDVALIFHEHGRVAGRENESRAEALAFRMFLRLASSQVSCFVCVSDYARDQLVKAVRSAAVRTQVVPNPIAAPVSNPTHYDVDAARREMKIPVGAFVVGFAGRLVQTKGWREFLAAIELLSSRIPTFFLVAGDGVDRDAIHDRISMSGLQHCGQMLGHVQHMGAFYRMLDCLVMPSHWETHGLSHLEAQSYGVPVVVSDVPGLNATVHADEDALLFRAGDSIGLAERLFQIASDSALRSRLRTSGMANAARFSVDAFSARVDAIYSRICDQRTR